MKKYPRQGSASVAFEYLNNHVPQKAVRKALLRDPRVTREMVAQIDWRKSHFPGAKFTALYDRPLAEWPSYLRGRNSATA